MSLLSFTSPIDDTSQSRGDDTSMADSLKQCTLISFKRRRLLHSNCPVLRFRIAVGPRCRFHFCTFSRSQAVKAAVTAVPLCSHFCPTSGSGEISPGEMCLPEVGSTKGATVNLLRSMAPDHLQVRVVGIRVKCRKGQVRCRRGEQERSSIEKGCQLMSTQNSTRSSPR